MIILAVEHQQLLCNHPLLLSLLLLIVQSRALLSRRHRQRLRLPLLEPRLRVKRDLPLPSLLSQLLLPFLFEFGLLLIALRLLFIPLGLLPFELGPLLLSLGFFLGPRRVLFQPQCALPLHPRHLLLVHQRHLRERRGRCVYVGRGVHVVSRKLISYLCCIDPGLLLPRPLLFLELILGLELRLFLRQPLHQLLPRHLLLPLLLCRLGGETGALQRRLGLGPLRCLMPLGRLLRLPSHVLLVQPLPLEPRLLLQPCALRLRCGPLLLLPRLALLLVPDLPPLFEFH
mmetsp:Transcript_89894/g.257044  ORF Transcript_89894/g.257044 Transcript_89894/m.257044 type:complete len:286 (-) Transcript_89894:715-1572(-)